MQRDKNVCGEGGGGHWNIWVDGGSGVISVGSTNIYLKQNVVPLPDLHNMY